jgi:hypothetical protein
MHGNTGIIKVVYIEFHQYLSKLSKDKYEGLFMPLHEVVLNMNQFK